MSGFQELYKEMLEKPKSREALLNDPAAELRKLGINPTPEVLAAVCGIIQDVEQLQKILGASKDEMKACVS